MVDRNTEVDQAKVTQLLDFGFQREQASLALKITQNDVELAVELLTGEKSDLESLNEMALAASGA